jgi:ribosomal protein S6--L-glutamate ligase
MESCIGIITVRDADYHPNRRLLEAARAAGAAAVLIHPYRLWPATLQGRLEVSGQTPVPRFNVVLPRQGAQIGDTCLALIRHFQLTRVPLINDLAAVTTARNKFLTQQALTAAGLPCPDTVFLNDPAGFQEAVSALGGYPIVTKPVNARQGEGVLRIGDAEDARRRVLDRLDRERGILIQRYLPPHKRRDFRALVIGGEVIGAATLTPPPGEFRANFHLGSSITAVSLPADLSRLAAAAAQAVGCDVAGVDLMVDADSRPVIVEVNYSPGFNGMEAATGLDIAGRIVRFALRRCRQTGAPQ